jgi:hypothetical protein
MSARLFCGASPVLLLAACADASPIQPADQSPPRSSFANGPSTPGNSGVFRVEGSLAFFATDPAHGLMSFHGVTTPWADLCPGTLPAFDLVDLQFIFTPAGAAEGVFQADLHNVFIYPAVDIGFSAGPEDCAIMATLPVLARGAASLVRTDNDFLGTGGPRANAFGWDAHGVLEDLVNGGEVGYSETVRWVFDQANPPAEIAPLVVSILLHARPSL